MSAATIQSHAEEFDLEVRQKVAASSMEIEDPATMYLHEFDLLMHVQEPIKQNGWMRKILIYFEFPLREPNFYWAKNFYN